ncbi:MAG: glycoside hydrolase family 88 protein, partial [Prolixibacteraceae bacterium]
QDRRTGLWFQVVDKGDRPDNWHDTSGSAMFLYAVKKAVELGLIPERPFEIVVKKAYSGILAKTIISQADGLIDVIDACDGLCVQPSYEAYINYPKKINAKEAVAGVLWASWIMEKSSK